MKVGSFVGKFVCMRYRPIDFIYYVYTQWRILDFPKRGDVRWIPLLTQIFGQMGPWPILPRGKYATDYTYMIQIAYTTSLCNQICIGISYYMQKINLEIIKIACNHLANSLTYITCTYIELS